MKLHGIALSNYYNMAKHAVLLKGIACEFVTTRPSQEPGFLAKSPMGKIPVLETEKGFLSETDAILDYLDEACPGPKLFPQDPFARAKVRQLMKVQELYVETPAHNLIGALFGRELPQHVKDASQPDARKGLVALGRLARFSPWIAGSDFTAADIVVFYSFVLSNRITQAVYGWDMLNELPGLREWFQRFEALDLAQQVLADNRAALEALAARAKNQVPN
ncbi:MAG: glutathione S-transferase family protein [Gammaproteobacteria bacterium]